MNLEEIKQKFLENNKEILKARRQWVRDAKKNAELAELIDQIPALPEEPKKFICGEYSIKFLMRYDKFLIAQVRKNMEANGFVLDYEVKEEDISDNWQNPRLDFKRDGLELRFEFADKYEDSTCHRKKIGHVEKLVDVYEWSCEEVENA